MVAWWISWSWQKHCFRMSRCVKSKVDHIGRSQKLIDWNLLYIGSFWSSSRRFKNQNWESNASKLTPRQVLRISAQLLESFLHCLTFSFTNLSSCPSGWEIVKLRYFQSLSEICLGISAVRASCRKIKQRLNMFEDFLKHVQFKFWSPGRWICETKQRWPVLRDGVLGCPSWPAASSMQHGMGQISSTTWFNRKTFCSYSAKQATKCDL